VRLRLATPDDTDSVAALFRRSFGSIGFLPTLHTPEEDRAFFGGVIARQEVWVAEGEGDGEMLGFAGLDGDLLGFLYVDPAAQGHGVGSRLLAHVRARRPGGFRFWVFQRNERARRFYERNGCRVVELTDGGGNEEREPDALYEWRP
jgi:GNAT superfamily N-acetyltransferase